MNMKIEISKIRPNPYRDFDLYPIDAEQVKRLQHSIHEHGFFSGVTARPVAIRAVMTASCMGEAYMKH